MPIFTYTTSTGTRYGVRVNYKDYRHTKKGFPSEEEAHEYYWRKRREMMLGAGDVSPEDMCLWELAARWVEFKAVRVKPSTLENYKTLIESRILPAFGERPLSRITPMELQGWLDKLPSPQIANKCRFLLGNMYRLAIRWRLCDYDPTRALDGYRENTAKGRALAPDELQALLSHLDETRRVQVTLAVSTGMRVGELNALTWSDITDEYISVDKAYRRGRLETPKTYKGKRRITISPTIASILRKHKTGHTGKLVFPGRGGRHQESHVLYYHLKRAADEVGIGKLRVHDLRHTYTTWMVQGRVDVKFLQDQLGHSDITTTLQVYTHTTEQTREDYRAWFDTEIAPKIVTLPSPPDSSET